MTRELLAFYVTFPDQETANKICDILIRERLIACSNLLGIEAAYWWKGSVQQENESLALTKTSNHLKEQIIARIEQIHPYEVPCIIHWPIQANESYRDWIINSVKD